MTASQPEYQQRPAPLAGYRALSGDEIDMVNAWKDTERQLAQLWAVTYDFPEVDRHCLDVAKDAFTTAFMWAVRGVARPRDVFAEARADPQLRGD